MNLNISEFSGKGLKKAQQQQMLDFFHVYLFICNDLYNSEDSFMKLTIHFISLVIWKW